MFKFFKSFGIKLGYRRIKQKNLRYIYCYDIFFLDLLQLLGEFEKEFELLISLIVKEVNYNLFLNNVMSNQGMCQFGKNK